MHDEAGALALVEAFLSTPFSGDERHSRRIAMLSAYEATGALPPLPAD
jgi:ribose 5-phosphate isomerase B